MTERLYYNDCYLREFQARVAAVEDAGRRVYLDRTAFYPTSGGQPFDLGTLGGIAVREVVELILRARGLWGGVLKHYELAAVGAAGGSDSDCRTQGGCDETALASAGVRPSALA